MQPEQYTQVERLRTFLKRCKSTHHDHLSLQSLSEQDSGWDAAQFWSFLLHAGNIVKPTGTTDEFQRFKLDYANSSGDDVEDSFLFENFWLREVTGFIKIPAGIRTAVAIFGEIEPFRQELEFLLEKFPKTNLDTSIYALSDFDAARKAYEEQYGVILQDEGLYYRRWLTVNEDKVELANIETYFRQYEKHWSKFRFLKAYIGNLESVSNQVVTISTTVVESHYEKFRAAYSRMPTLQSFIENGYLTKTVNTYLFSPRNIKCSLKNKVAASLWQHVADDSSYASDRERLQEWMLKTIYWEVDTDLLAQVDEADKLRFLEIADEVINSEHDLVGLEQELEKIFLDRLSSNGVVVKPEKNFFALRDESLFDLLSSMYLIEERPNSTYFHDQGSRNTLMTLIGLLVRHDASCEKTINLLKQGLNKPFLLWATTRWILHIRLDAIPKLLTDPELVSLSFLLIDQIDYPDDEKEYLNLEAWKKSIELALWTFSFQFRTAADIVTKGLFEIFGRLHYNKYAIRNQTREDMYLELQKARKRKEETILKLIEGAYLEQNSYNPAGSRTYLLPVVFNSLSALVIKQPAQIGYQNGLIQFPLMKWAGLTWLLRASTYFHYTDQFDLTPPERNNIVDAFLDSYLDTIKTKEIIKIDLKTFSEKPSTPCWAEKIERLVNIDWLYPIYFFHKAGKLEQFLAPPLEVIETEDLYDERNKFTADKIRTHIGVLMQILKKLVLPELPYGFESKEIDAIKSRIESKITDYILVHTVNEPQSGKLDIFNFNKEMSFNSGGKEALLPDIARAINWFSKKDLIINAIVNTGDLNKILTIADYITSEGVRKRLLSKVTKINVLTFLEGLNWIPEIQNTLVKISRYPELVEQTEEAKIFWELQVAEKREDFQYQMQLFQTELLLAYIRKNENELNSIKVPAAAHPQILEQLKPEDYRQFYQGLMFIEDRPERGHEIFNQLCKKFPNNPLMAFNRLIARYNLAEKVDSLSQLNIGIAEWQASEETMPATALESIERDLVTMKLHIFSKLNKDTDLDSIFEKLDIADKMQADNLSVKIDSLIKRRRIDEATILIDSAEAYHKSDDLSEIEVINRLRDKISDKDNLAQLQINYSRIYQCRPSKLIQILPENLNGKKNLNEFIVQEFVYAADRMLDKIKSIDKIGGEDKYNDLIEVILSSRISTLGWQLVAQSRGAFSEELGIQPGERDLTLIEPSRKIMMVCEAFILRSETAAKEHLLKVFNYYHQRSTFLMLVYDKGERSKNFLNNWTNYINTIIRNAHFDSTYALIPPAKDVTSDFGIENSAIKVGKSNHQSGTEIFHIFVNINYQIPLPELESKS
nr:hypothetical protein [uncultured Dyadobacter sp.]